MGCASYTENMFWIKHQLPVAKTFELSEQCEVCSISSKSQAHLTSDTVNYICIPYFILVFSTLYCQGMNISRFLYIRLQKDKHIMKKDVKEKANDIT